MAGVVGEEVWLTALMPKGAAWTVLEKVVKLEHTVAVVALPSKTSCKCNPERPRHSTKSYGVFRTVHAMWVGCFAPSACECPVASKSRFATLTPEPRVP